MRRRRGCREIAEKRREIRLTRIIAVEIKFGRSDAIAVAQNGVARRMLSSLDPARLPAAVPAPPAR